MKFRITHYTNREGEERWKVQVRWLFFWFTFHRPGAAGVGWRDHCSEEEVEKTIDRLSGKKSKLHSVRVIDV